jgi:hypothetical protein
MLCCLHTRRAGPSPHQPAALLLSYPPPRAGSSLCCQLAAFGGVGASLLETWEVFIHSLPSLDLSALVGETVSLERLVEAGAGEALQLSCHGLCRDELQVCGWEGRAVVVLPAPPCSAAWSLAWAAGQFGWMQLNVEWTRLMCVVHN